jgi:NAD(P)H-dependent FMN reductase
MNILAMSGSRKSQSSSSALVRAAAAQRSHGVESRVSERLGDLALLNPDLDGWMKLRSGGAT